jgi:hypothetical protein
MSKGQDFQIPSLHARAPSFFGFFGSFTGRCAMRRTGG